jgi:hypothetical protein
MTGLSEFGKYAGPAAAGDFRRRAAGAENKAKPAQRAASIGGDRLAILQRIRAKDRTAIKECIDAYGAFVWTLAQRFAKTTHEAEMLTEEIFRDIWQVSEADCLSQSSSERKVIALIALRRLLGRPDPQT